MGAGLNPLPGVHLLRVSSQGGEQKSEGLSQVWLHLHDLMTTHMLAFQHMNHWGGGTPTYTPPLPGQWAVILLLASISTLLGRK